MRLIIIILISIVFPTLLIHAQPPKREMRATWLTTVWRNDWPSVTVPSGGSESARQAAINTQKNGLIDILDKLQEANINTMFFQIRSMCDAFYPSSYEPWSHFVSDIRGADPGYDPLAFAIEEAHKRGIELHAWINPYRYSSSSGTHGNLPNDYVNTNPEWLLDYGGQAKILNPGLPEVTQRITDIVEEVITNYNLDGIVFDDYFYMSGTTNAMDQAQFDAYNPDNLSRGDWRRQNVNKMVASVYNKIQSIKPYVTFGISPAGVAASNVAVAEKYGVPPCPTGSDWQYNDIFSDPLAWLSEGTVDYISPQLYWVIGHGTNDYAALSEWWSNIANHFGKHFYSSHSLSAMGNSKDAIPEYFYLQDENIPAETLSSLEWSLVQAPSKNPKYPFSEVGLQVDCNRIYDLNDAPGSVFFATAKATGSSFVSYLKTSVFTKPSLRPAIGWKVAEDQGLVENLTLMDGTLSWDYYDDNVRFAVYAIPNGDMAENMQFSSSYLLGISYEKQYVLPANASTHKLAVSVFDRYGNEFAPFILGEGIVAPEAAQLLYPENNAEVILPVVFRWSEIAGANSYILELAKDEQFTDMVFSRETVDAQFYSGLQTNMEDNVTYFWRVKARKPNSNSVYSETRSFTGTKFKIISPANGSVDIPITPTFEWSYISPTASYTLEISRSAQFIASQQAFKQTLQTNTITLPENTLISGTNYFARVSFVDGVLEATSERIGFRIIELPVPVPVIISPEDEAEVTGTSISVNWQQQTSKGFRVELSESLEFPPRSTTIKSVDAYTYSVVYDNLAPGSYYVRVRASAEGGLTESSEVIKIYLISSGVGIEEKENSFNCFVYNDNSGNHYLKIKSVISENIDIAVYSVSGVLCSQQKDVLFSGDNNIKLNTGNLPKGIYLVKIDTEKGSRILKMMKK